MLLTIPFPVLPSIVSVEVEQQWLVDTVGMAIIKRRLKGVEYAKMQ